MADYYRDEHEGGGFMMGLLTGTVLGAGLGMLLAPKSGSELRNQLTEGASSLGRRASGAVNEISERARDTVHRGTEQLRGRASDANVTGSTGTTGGSTYTGSTADFDPDRR